MGEAVMRESRRNVEDIARRQIFVDDRIKRIDM